MVSYSDAPFLKHVAGGWKRLLQGARAIAVRDSRRALPSRYADRLPLTVTEAWSNLSAYDQRHLLAVGDWLQQRTYPESVVLAGVLHDIGKPANTRLGSRIGVVVLNWIGHRSLSRFDGKRLRVFQLLQLPHLLDHATIGADFLAANGVSPEVVWLVRQHESTGSHPYLCALQDADGQC